MQAGYFQTAWNDIKHSEGWFKKFVLLALLQFVPIFGQIVLFGYLYGWARDIAWNIHAPMPERIFGNEDGKLYSRGFFILVIALVFSLVPGIISSASSALADSGSVPALGFASGLGLVSVALALFCSVLAWVGSMRTAIYGRLGPGFQIKQIWKMLGHDTNGMLRILGMNLLIGFILALVFSVVVALIVFVAGAGAFASMAAAGGSPIGMSEAEVLGSLLPALGLGGLVLLVATFFLLVGAGWLEALVARALGYWTRQFNVPAWGGQDDPLPFEAAQAAQAAQQAQYAAQVQYAQAQAQAAQVQGQRIAYQDQQAQQSYAQAQQQAQTQQPASVQPATSSEAAQPAEAAQPTPSSQPAAPIWQAAATNQQDAAQATQQAQQQVQPLAPQAPSQPDWIAQVNDMAPTEQRDPFAPGGQDVPGGQDGENTMR